MMIMMMMMMMMMVIMMINNNIITPLFQIPDNLFSTVCAAPNWLLHLGFSLGYGSMFTKIWRVHRIATHTKTKGEDKIKVSHLHSNSISQY